MVGQDRDEVAGMLDSLLRDGQRCQAMVHAGLELVANGRGAVDRILALIASRLPPAED